MARAVTPVSYWDTILDWLKADTEISGWLNEGEIQALTKEDLNELTLWAEAEGFDIKRVLKVMRANYQTYIAPVTRYEIEVKMTMGNEERTFKYSTHEPMLKDVTFLIFIFASRGTVWTKVQEKIMPELRTIVDWLITKYSIDVTNRAPGTVLGPDVITIARVASCFPSKMCDFYDGGFGKLLCGFSDLCVLDHEGISPAILCNHFASMIPAAWVKATLGVHCVLFLTHVVTDNVLYKKDKNMTGLEDILTYYLVAFNSAGSPEAAR